jgi:hypothetical protein
VATKTSYKPATCLICDTANSSNATLCQECCAPLALGQDREKQRDPRIVSVIGDSNVGKTVYLGFLLDMLSQRAENFEAVPRGAYSVDLPQTVISYMAHRMFPPKTPVESNEWNWAYYEVCKRTRSPRWADLVMPDMAGEAIAAEIDAPSTFRVIQKLLSKSAGLMLLIDGALAANGSAQPDFFGLKMLSYLDSMFGRGRKKKISMPIAIVLTKADYTPQCFDDPQRFAQANLNRLWNMCESRFSNIAFFASSVVGSLGFATTENDDYATPVPLHTSLRGILEPFEWVLEQL